MSIDSITARPPKPSYMGRNGFLGGPTDPDSVTSLSQALDIHQRAMYVIQHKKRAVPSFEKMKTEVERSDEVNFVKECIQELQSEHVKDLETMYDFHASEYLEEVMNRYASKSDFTLDDNDPEAVKAQESLFPSKNIHLLTSSLKKKELISGPLKDLKTHIDWTNNHELLRYTYLSTYLPLKKHQLDLQFQEERLKRQQDQMFPQSKEEWNSKPNDVKIRVAKFLVAEPAARQERMMSDFGWAWRQVKTLQDVFVKDDLFKAEIQGLVIAAEARDPRKRPPA